VIQVADLVFDATYEDGSQPGGVSVRVENIPAHAVAPFKTALAQHDTRTALVREATPGTLAHPVVADRPRSWPQATIKKWEDCWLCC